MKKVFFLLLLTVSIIANLKAQSLTKADILALNEIIGNFLFDAEEANENYTNCKSEFFTCVIDLDSNSRVKSVIILHDGKNIDSAFAILSRLRPANFKNWNCVKCKNKTIIMPILVISAHWQDEYIRKLTRVVSQRRVSVLSETSGIIYLSPFQYHHPTAEE